MLLLGLLSIGISQAALAALKEGDAAPDFKAQASLAGKAFSFSLKDALAKGPVVVYFFPSAYTQGCNIQAHEFAVRHDKFVAANATVIGVSLDSIARLNDFSADPDFCGGKVPAASDADGTIAKSYDLTVRDVRAGIKDTRGVEIDHGFAERTTFVVAPNGKIVSTIGGLAPVENVEKALAVVQQVAKGIQSGIVIATLVEGTGASPERSDSVKVHYRGKLDNGKEFDSSYSRGQPATFPLTRVIPCWTEGVQTMKVGGKARLICPPNLAYGSKGVPGVIPPDSTLTFEVELLGIVR